MSDQGMFQRNINSDGAAAQAFDNAGGDIDSPTSVAVVDSALGDVTVVLPDQLASAGMRITVVKPDALNEVGVTIQAGDFINGVNTTIPMLAGTPFLSLTFVSTGSSWVVV